LVTTPNVIRLPEDAESSAPSNGEERQPSLPIASFCFQYTYPVSFYRSMLAVRPDEEISINVVMQGPLLVGWGFVDAPREGVGSCIVQRAPQP
jgi:hypothetical protein